MSIPRTADTNTSDAVAMGSTSYSPSGSAGSRLVAATTGAAVGGVAGFIAAHTPNAPSTAAAIPAAVMTAAHGFRSVRLGKRAWMPDRTFSQRAADGSGGSGQASG